MNASKTVLVVVAHADDMEFMAGGTIASPLGVILSEAKNLSLR